MRIKKIVLKSFKRFTDLTIGPLSPETRLVVLIGPNGSGKSSLLEAANHWHAFRGWSNIGDEQYLYKRTAQTIPDSWFSDSVEITFHGAESGRRDVRDKFYFRNAYRNEPDFTVAGLQRIGSPVESPTLNRFIANEQLVSKNYQRLVGEALRGIFSNDNDQKQVAVLRDELIGKVKAALAAVFDDLALSSIGDPLGDGSFFFKKGESEEFHYKNLSAGEKSVFDLILDIVVNAAYYPDAIFFIDEPEAHIHTEKQAGALREIYKLIPDEGQLWCSTHSLGMLVEAQRIEEDNPGTVAFLDFGGRDFDAAQHINPSPPDRRLWEKTLELALGSIAPLVGPSVVYICEGDPNGRTNKSFDAQVLERIFGSEMTRAAFVSVGGCEDVTNPDNVAVKTLEAIFPSAELRRVVDRDYLSEQEVADLRRKGVRVLSERHLETYLLSDEIIAKLCESVGQNELQQEVLERKHAILAERQANGGDVDDVKAAAGLIVNELRRLLQVTGGGSKTGPFLRDTVARLITPDTETYQRLKADLE